MSGRSALITGASTGIGRATAVHLARNGWRIYAGVRREADGASLQSEAGPAVVPILLDVTDGDQVRSAAAEITEAVGTGGLQGLVNNAGISVSGPVEFTTLADWRLQFEVNLFGPVAVTQALLPALRSARGRIVNVGSIAGRNALPFLGPYAASKHALEAVTDALRVEVAPFGIHVAVIEPGAIATPIWEKGTRSAMERISQFPPEALALYGQAIAAISQAARKNASEALPVERVVRVITHALTSPRPGTRYLVGREARAQAMVNELLPNRIRDEIIRRYIRLPGQGAAAKTSPS
jgi:NAD(P)-dependent dehydrogenase (short-subunit alcohol dehydrogenase family)